VFESSRERSSDRRPLALERLCAYAYVCARFARLKPFFVSDHARD
jgi:hypothetical protein